MKEYQTAFIELARRVDALKFGEFTLKSGRASPYFFNAGAFCTGGALAQLGRCYAAAIVESGLEFDVLLGWRNRKGSITIGGGWEQQVWGGIADDITGLLHDRDSITISGLKLGLYFLF